MVKARKYILCQHFKGLPKNEDLKIVEEELPPIKNGEFLAEAVYLSVDSYVTFFETLQPLGSVVPGSQVARIVESKNPRFPVSKYICAEYGWRTHTIGPTKADDYLEVPPEYILPDFGDLPYSLGVGVLGITGNTAYFGLLEICKPKPGETVVVSGAAGPVGNIAGQIAKIKGCKVIGFAGSDEKGKYLTNELGFDYFINYKEPGLDKKLKEFAPQGIDCYFDNVGGDISSIILSQMNTFGRVSVCGSVTGYSSDVNNIAKATIVQGLMVVRQLRMEGFWVHRWRDRWMEAIKQNLKWIKEGKLKYKETVTLGFENMLPALLDVLNGRTIWKAVLKV